MSVVLGRHRKAEPALDVAGAIANLRAAVKHCGRAMDLCDRQEIAALELVVHEQQRIVDLDNRAITLLRAQLVAATRPGVAS